MDNEVKSTPTPDIQSNPNQNLNQTQPTETTPTKPKRKIPFLKIFIFGFVIIITILAFSLIAYLIIGNQTKQKAITTYEECIAAGFPIMESYPEQCAVPDGQTFTRILTAEEQKKLDSKPVTTPELTPFPTLTASEAATWKTYKNNQYNYLVKYPSELSVSDKECVNSYCVLFLTPTDGPSLPPEFYISVIPDGYWENGAIYNYLNEEFLENLASIKIGETKSPFLDSSSTSEFFNFTRMPDIKIEGITAMVFHNGNPWEAESDDRVIIKLNNYTYMIGAYNQGGLSKKFNQVLSTFKFTKELTPLSPSD